MTNRRQKEYYNEKLFRCIFDREDVCFFPYDYAVIEESDRLASLLKEHPELEECCFSKRMRKVFRKNEKSMLQNCNKTAKRKGRLQRVKKPM